MRGDLSAAINRFPRVALVMFLYVAVNFLSAWASSDAGALLEAGGRAYLAVLAFLVIAYLQRYGEECLVRWWSTATVVVSVVTIIYYLLVVGGMTDHLNWIGRIKDYPYIGEVIRLRGTANVYGMNFMLLLPGWIFLFSHWQKDRDRVLELLIVTVAMLLTLSKECALLPIAVLIMEMRPLAWRGKIMLGLMIAGLMAGVHFLLVQADFATLQTEATSGREWPLGPDYKLAETNYTENKRAAWLVWQANFWVGVGPGRFAASTEPLVGRGEYPAHFGRFDPHSAWTGALAETGILGFITLAGLVCVLFYHRPYQVEAFAVLLFLFLVVSVFKDVMNFRGLWVIIGAYLGTSLSKPTYQLTEEDGGFK